ncbi:hypothetical protein [Streptomyces endophyticus]|uniref:Secreted protein n=1 Tax=Streptomyces endophyticus TaxID=714166 RepID=A0ABU6F150_9ACTN|nr:hypothetical protein [Streptomyces endophyticus]MEB8337709.1 hypothetical protein [Streptomyces endophyticus]
MLSVVIALVAIKLGTARPSDAVGGGSGNADPVRTAVSSTPPTEDPTSDEPTDDPTSDEPSDDPTTDEPSPTDTYIPFFYRSRGTSFYRCDDEDRLASTSGLPITWSIDNDSSTDLTVYWLDSRGYRSSQRSLDSGGSVNFNRVYTGSVFVFTTKDSSCSKVIRVSPGASYASTTIVDED